MKRLATALVAVGLLAAPMQAQTTISQEKASSLSNPALYVPFATALAGAAVWGLTHSPAASTAGSASVSAPNETVAATPGRTSTADKSETHGTTGASDHGTSDHDTPTQSVPEPASILLVATGLLGMAVLHRRRALRLDE